MIEARKQSYATDLQVKSRARMPRNLLGPGAAIVNEDGQGMTRLATAGCLVRDGERYYILTNKHAIGESGNPITAMLAHRSTPIGVSAKPSLTRKEFREVYPHFASDGQHLVMDVGLIDLNDVTQWKAQFPSITNVQPVLDLYDNSLTLELIGQKVVGESAVTGIIRGEIQALFYRFKAMGGSEYISDFLIGPESSGAEFKRIIERPGKNRSLAVHHGDSGAVLHIEQELKDEHNKPTGHFHYHPFAMLWGEQEFVESEARLVQPFALATSLSTALDLLNLDLVRDINLDQDYVWGWVGHYVIGGQLEPTIALLKSPQLRDFISKNVDLLTIDPVITGKGKNEVNNDPKVLDKNAIDVDHPQFVPLADVPDNVWKSNVNFYTDDDKKRHSGPGNRGQFDNSNHFADMDLPYGGEKRSSSST